MNTGQILQGAWHNVLRYRALWVFGIILALVTFSWSTAALFGRDDEGNTPAGIGVVRRPGETWGEAAKRTLRQEIDQADRALEAYLARELNLEVESDIVRLITVLMTLAAVLYLAGRVARYVCETALIRMVDRQQETGQQQTARQGFRLGWSRCAWRLFFIELLVNLVAIAAGLLLFALIFSPLPLWVEGGEGAVIVGAIVTAALFLLAILVVILLAIGASLLKILARRACASEGLGVAASVYRGYGLLRRNVKRILPLWLVQFALDATWPAVLGLALLLLLGVGVLLGGLPALLVNWLARQVVAEEPAVLAAVAVGAVILILILIAPLVWLDGMRQVFLSSMWTLAYRELSRLDQAAQAASPEALAPLLDVAAAPRERPESGPSSPPPTR